MLPRFGQRCAAALLAALPLVSSANVCAQYTIINVIPVRDSAETDQNSEPNLAVNPNNVNQVIIGTFANNFNNPYYQTQNTTTWTRFQNVNHGDETIKYSSNGNAYAAVLINGMHVNRSTTPNAPLFTAIPSSQYSPFIDQPYITATNVGGADHIYVGMNNFSGTQGRTAAIRYSTDSGTTWRNEFIERVPQGPGHHASQDGPPVRVAANGNTVYAAFQRWDGPFPGASPSHVVVVKDNNGGIGATPFRDLGGANGVIAANTTDFFNNNSGLGQQRVGSNMTLTVDPNNPNRVVVGYANVRNGLPFAQVSLSTDGGLTWTQVFQSQTNSALSALAIAKNGTIGMLYTDLVNGRLQTHMLQTNNNFASLTDQVFFSFVNGSPGKAFDPYIGDFQDLLAVDDTFYGVFSASNNLNQVQTPFGGLLDFDRLHAGNPSMGTFVLKNAQGGNVRFSIDPYYFQIEAQSPIPEPATIWLLAIGGCGMTWWVRHRRT